MGIESERTALSIESIPKSVSEVQMDQTADTLGGENAEPPERLNQQKVNEKNGNLDFLISSLATPHKSDDSQQCITIKSSLRFLARFAMNMRKDLIASFHFSSHHQLDKVS